MHANPAEGFQGGDDAGTEMAHTHTHTHSRARIPRTRPHTHTYVHAHLFARIHTQTHKDT